MTLAFLLFLPLILPFIWKIVLGYTLNWQEVFLNVALVALLVGGAYSLSRGAMMADTEIWSGEITGKAKTRVSCEHSYVCNCTTDSNGNTSCDTCYEHSHDYDWRVNTNVGDFNIQRIDRRGSREPPRFSAVTPGEPAAREHRYTNYVQAANGSLYQTRMLDYSHMLDVPEYPKVFDYHRANRVLFAGVTPYNNAQWQTLMSEAHKALGPQKQAHVTLILTTEADRAYRYKVEAAWQGTNKNDVVVILSLDDTRTIQWAEVITWAGGIGNEALQVYLRDALQNLNTAENPEQVTSLIATEVNAHFVRPQMKQFEYLKAQIQPPLGVLVALALLGLGASLALTRYFHRNDVRIIK